LYFKRSYKQTVLTLTSRIYLKNVLTNFSAT